MTAETIALPYSAFFLLIFVCGISTYFVGLGVGYLLRRVFVAVNAFLKGFSAEK